MKMGDGGYRPAFNVQFATDCKTRIIVTTQVNNQGTDFGLMAPMHRAIQDRYGVIPKRQLVD